MLLGMSRQETAEHKLLTENFDDIAHSRGRSKDSTGEIGKGPKASYRKICLPQVLAESEMRCGCTTGWQPDEHCGCGGEERLRVEIAKHGLSY